MNSLEKLEKACPAFFKAYADNVEALDKLDGVLLGQGHIIMTGENAIKPELIKQADGYQLDGAEVCAIIQAPRFNQSDAEKLAAAIKNGHGERARAVHIRDALAAAIDIQRDIIKTLALI